MKDLEQIEQSIDQNDSKIIISAALEKIASVQYRLANKNAPLEIKKIFPAALTFISSNQLELDDRYFLRGLAKLELAGVLLSEIRLTQESGTMVEACGMLRQAYVTYIKKSGQALDGNKVCAEFYQVDSKSKIIDDSTFKRINSLFLSVALSGNNYFLGGLGGVKVEQLDASATLSEHAKFLRDNYHRLHLVKLGLAKLAKSDQTDSSAYWRDLISMIPGGIAPIALDYLESESTPKSGLIGLSVFCKELASLVIVSEIMRTHPSGMFKIISATFASIIQTLIQAISSYCNKIGGRKLNNEIVLAKSQDLIGFFHSHFMHELTEQYQKIYNNPEFQPQAESIALALNIQKVSKAA